MIGNISTRGCISSQKFSPKYEVKSFRQESWQQYRYLFRNMKLSQHLKQSGLSGHRSRWVNVINIFLKNIHFIFLPEWHCSLDFWCYCNISSVALRKCAELWTKLNQSTGRGLSISVCGSNVEHKSTNVNPLLWMFYHFWDANNHLFDLPRARAVQILQFLKTLGGLRNAFTTLITTATLTSLFEHSCFDISHAPSSSNNCASVHLKPGMLMFIMNLNCLRGQVCLDPAPGH